MPEAGSLGATLEDAYHKAHLLRTFLLFLKLLFGFPKQTLLVFLRPEFFPLSSIQYINIRLSFLKHIVDQTP